MGDMDLVRASIHHLKMDKWTFASFCGITVVFSTWTTFTLNIFIVWSVATIPLSLDLIEQVKSGGGGFV